MDSELILSIQLSRTGEEDILVWHYTKTGLFSVRSAYHPLASWRLILVRAPEARGINGGGGKYGKLYLQIRSRCLLGELS